MQANSPFHFDSTVLNDHNGTFTKPYACADVGTAIAFDGYSDCSDNSDGDLKQTKHDTLDDVSTTSGDDNHFCYSADEQTTVCMSSSSGDEQPWAAASSKLACGTEAGDVKRMPRVYPLTLMLQIRTLLAVCGPQPGALTTRGIDEVAHKGVCRMGSKHANKHRQNVPVRTDRATNEDKYAISVRAILAPLPGSNVKVVAEKLKELGVNSLQQFSVLLNEVRERANANHSQAVCAELCVELKSIRKIMSVAGADGEPNSFRQLVLDSCWPHFHDFLEKGHCATQTCRRHGVTTVRYISELILKGLVSPRMLITAGEMLIDAITSDTRFTEALEALLGLLTVAAPQFDSNPSWVHKERMNLVFQRLEELVQTRAVPPSLSLLIGEVVVLRRAGWQGGTSRCQVGQMHTCVARSVEREPPKPKQHVRQAQTTRNDSTTMLSLAREMLLAPVAVSHRKSKEVPKFASQSHQSQSSAADAMSIAKKSSAAKATPFSAVAFHRVLAIVLRGINSTGDVATAVSKIGSQNVPRHHQAREYADLLTRACEMSRKATRVSAFGLAAGLLAEPCVFEPTECMRGVQLFFTEVCPDLKEEVPDLDTMLRTELLPALRAVFPDSDLSEFVPEV